MNWMKKVEISSFFIINATIISVPLPLMLKTVGVFSFFKCKRKKRTFENIVKLRYICLYYRAEN